MIIRTPSQNPRSAILIDLTPYLTVCCALQARGQDSTVLSLTSVASQHLDDLRDILPAPAPAPADAVAVDDDIVDMNYVAACRLKHTL